MVVTVPHPKKNRGSIARKQKQCVTNALKIGVINRSTLSTPHGVLRHFNGSLASAPERGAEVVEPRIEITTPDPKIRPALTVDTHDSSWQFVGVNEIMGSS